MVDFLVWHLRGTPCNDLFHSFIRGSQEENKQPTQTTNWPMAERHDFKQNTALNIRMLVADEETSACNV